MSEKITAGTRGVSEEYFRQSQELQDNFQAFDTDGNGLLTQDELTKAYKNQDLTRDQRVNAAYFTEKSNVSVLDQFEHPEDQGNLEIGRGDVEKFTGGQGAKEAAKDDIDYWTLADAAALVYLRRGQADTAATDSNGKTFHGPDGLIGQNDIQAMIDNSKDPYEKRLFQYFLSNFSLFDQLQNPQDKPDKLVGFGDLRTAFGIPKDPDSEF